MSNTLIPNGQLIVFNFPAGAGGKMLQNCVGLSQHCILSKKEYVRWQLEFQGPGNDAFYHQKLQWVLDTIPEKNDIKNWLAYEIDKDDPVGFNFMGYREGRTITNLDYYRLAKQGIWATAVVHNYGGSEYFINYWPTIHHVCLTNSQLFAKKSLSLKNVSLSYDEDWATQGRTEPERCFNFDVDSTIYNTDLFVQQVKQLYEYLKFDDFRADLISEYHKKYIAIH